MSAVALLTGSSPALKVGDGNLTVMEATKEEVHGSPFQQDIPSVAEIEALGNVMVPAPSYVPML